MLSDGSLPELHKTASFGSRSVERLAKLREHQPTGPLMCAEFWNGWFDHWGAHHHTTSVEQSAADLDELLAAGASVNLYMLHGGTNFGFTNGANDKGVYQATVTSYDYDAPLSESGEPTEKFWAFRDVIAKYAPVPAEKPEASAPAPTPSVSLDRVVSLRSAVQASSSALGAWSPFGHLPALDELGHYRGFAVYKAAVGSGGVLSFAEVRDRAQVFLDGAPVGVLSRDHHDSAIVLPTGGVLEILVEDQGRVNYGERIGEHKGLIGPALLDGVEITEWEVLPLALDSLTIEVLFGTTEPEEHGAADATAASHLSSIAGPAFAAGTFTIDAPADLFLSTAGWGKGNVYVNGFNLGRYWSRGPQTTLYVPAPILRVGVNEIVIFETLTAASARISFVPSANLGHTDF